jgi:hypothetical protein
MNATTFSTNSNGTTTKTFAGQMFTLKADDFGGMFWDNGCGGLHPCTLADQVALEGLDLCFPEQETSQDWNDTKDVQKDFSVWSDDVVKHCDDAHADNDFMF